MSKKRKAGEKIGLGINYQHNFVFMHKMERGIPHERSFFDGR
jgi:hypothetical protein